MNAGRREPITLRYFQQLAALYAELFLDRRAAAPEALARDIDRYVREKVRLMPVTYPVKGITPARPQQARVLDGHRERQDADHAPQLPPVPALRGRRGSGQHHPDHAQRGAQRPAHGRDGRFGHFVGALRGDGAAGGPPPDRAGDGDHQAGREEEGEGDGRQHRGGGARRPQSRVRRRGAPRGEWGGLARGPGRRGRARLHLRIQRNLRSGAGRGPRQPPHARLRKVHRLRLLLPLLPRRRVREGLPRPQRHGVRSAARADRPASPRQPALVPRTAARPPRQRGRAARLQPGAAAVGLRRDAASTRSTGATGAKPATCSTCSSSSTGC